MIPQTFEYAAPTTLAEALGLHCRRREAIGRRHEPDPDDEAAPGRAGATGRPRTTEGPELYPRSKRRDSRRRDVPRITRSRARRCCAGNARCWRKPRRTSATRRCATWAPSAAASRMPTRRRIIRRRCRRSKRSSCCKDAKSERTVSAADFFVDTFTTALEPGEIVSEVIVPVEAREPEPAIRKWSQPASGFAIVGIAARIQKIGRQNRHGAHRRHGTCRIAAIARRRRKRRWKARRVRPAEIQNAAALVRRGRGCQRRSVRVGRLPQASGRGLCGARDHGRALEVGLKISGTHTLPFPPDRAYRDDAGPGCARPGHSRLRVA